MNIYYYKFISIQRNLSFLAFNTYQPELSPSKHPSKQKTLFSQASKQFYTCSLGE